MARNHVIHNICRNLVDRRLLLEVHAAMVPLVVDAFLLLLTGFPFQILGLMFGTMCMIL